VSDVSLYDTRTRSLQPFAPRDPARVGIYACGPTVYARVHVGNARPFVVFSQLKRFLEHEGYGVTLVGNITDINGRPRTAVARLTASGQPDATFGSGGRVVYEVRAAAVWEYSNSVATLPDGRILVGGTSALCACGGQADAGTLTMFAPNGQINRFFGANGTERFGSEFGPDAQNLQASSMVVSGDYVYVTGWANNPIGSNNQDFATARVIVPLFRSGFEAAAPAP